MTDTLTVTDDDASSVYGTSTYGRATAQQIGGRWLCLADVESGWRVPLVLDGDAATSPYGYAGIQVSPAASEPDIASAWENTVSTLQAHGIVSAFFRFAPFSPLDQRLSTLPGLELRTVSTTVLVSTPTEEAAWTGMLGRARTAVRKAQRSGLTASVRPATLDDVLPGGDFRRLYDATMARRDARDTLRFRDDYYRILISGLDDRVLIAMVTDDEGRCVAATLLLLDDEILHYHLSGSDPAGARLGANNLMLWTALQHAAQTGLKAVHLGGGQRAGDALFDFKASFGGHHVPFVVGRAIIDPQRYETLSERRAAELGCTREQLDATGHFPAYRASPPERHHA